MGIEAIRALIREGKIVIHSNYDQMIRDFENMNYALRSLDMALMTGEKAQEIAKMQDEWRVDFEAGISLQARSKNGKGKYANSLYQNRWEGYCEGRAKALTQIDKRDSLLKKGLSYIMESKAKFYPNTTNSLVDEWIDDVKKIIPEGY